MSTIACAHGTLGFAIRQECPACIITELRSDTARLLKWVEDDQQENERLQVAIRNYLSEKDSPARDFVMIQLRLDELRTVLHKADSR